MAYYPMNGYTPMGQVKIPVRQPYSMQGYTPMGHFIKKRHRHFYTEPLKTHPTDQEKGETS